ncbi:hypothetical protein RRG08_017018 [Elysia crispata]|uniref:Uncharacterized protein n=1 Tax=Elysia crispata TaxID=231223 RepID=A0AAE0XZD1_9GAST|nr:hypothetical protein RRG08_017018 [Elysia crispata]
MRGVSPPRSSKLMIVICCSKGHCKGPECMGWWWPASPLPNLMLWRSMGVGGRAAEQAVACRFKTRSGCRPSSSQ